LYTNQCVLLGSIFRLYMQPVNNLVLYIYNDHQYWNRFGLQTQSIQVQIVLYFLVMVTWLCTMVAFPNGNLVQIWLELRIGGKDGTFNLTKE
jgi:hypothetical protein